ncbi:hypothetical protein HDA39_006217 [Kribbella italica]|uniref:Uncharacterized protein n=1 Tax=Kribbella italica TaxID=1540520 RepID=A0A7W9JC94_9ACTN|nr:hypothetical protein [Kribbella italica]
MASDEDWAAAESGAELGDLGGEIVGRVGGRGGLLGGEIVGGVCGRGGASEVGLRRVRFGGGVVEGGQRRTGVWG